MTILKARIICQEALDSAEANQALAALRQQHGANFLEWFDQNPAGGSDQDLLQWLEITRSTAAVAMPLLNVATEQIFSADEFQMPASDPDKGLKAVENLRLSEETVFIVPSGPVDVSVEGLVGASLIGALCWQPENAFNCVPFVEQGGNSAPFGHILIDPSLDLDGMLLTHPGLLMIGKSGAVGTDVAISSTSLSGATYRSGAQATHLVAGALWRAEAQGW